MLQDATNDGRARDTDIPGARATRDPKRASRKPDNEPKRRRRNNNRNTVPNSASVEPNAGRVGKPDTDTNGNSGVNLPSENPILVKLKRKRRTKEEMLADAKASLSTASPKR